MDWQPIDTAPRDQRVILYRPTAKHGNGIDVARYDDNRYAEKPRPYWSSDLQFMGVQRCRDHAPTHWMPMPQPPSTETA